MKLISRPNALMRALAVLALCFLIPALRSLSSLTCWITAPSRMARLTTRPPSGGSAQ